MIHLAFLFAAAYFHSLPIKPLYFLFCFPETGTGHLTVGKLYGGILIYDNWKKTKFGQIEELRQQEAELEALEKAEAEEERLRLRQEAIDRGEDPDEVDRELERQRAMEAGEGGYRWMAGYGWGHFGS